MAEKSPVNMRLAESPISYLMAPVVPVCRLDMWKYRCRCSGGRFIDIDVLSMQHRDGPEALMSYLKKLNLGV